jgi:hypothetical protein
MKVEKYGIKFDSDLEVQYFEYLRENKIDFVYHPHTPIKLNSKNKYTPDFIVVYNDRIEIIETKGYSQFSFMKDNMIHNLMMEKTTDDLLEFLYNNDFVEPNVVGKDVIYRKIKYIKSYGWVDFDFKNPNTIANQRKNKINELTSELKEANNKVKKYERYLSYLFKDKLTKPQREWKEQFEREYRGNSNE